MKSYTGKTVYITGGSNGWLSRIISDLVIRQAKKGRP